MATPADADIILKLYDLRREEVMRKARNYVGMEFWPTTVDEFKEIHKPTNPNNVYWRQVISFWEGMAQLPLHGAVDAELYLATQGEALFLRAKFADISEEATGNTFMPSTKKLVDASEKAQAMFEGVKKNLAARRAQMTAAKATA
ncbi:DUF4760 domain-containing protein [Terriglobus roseus]|uniref:Uncharacterized protein n=1 Tax=Terriglobus roseus TaxID=392734 RepID=A0A1H4KIC8_9BACT|nr:hypothetical protein [Terriglobus roseus]SEB58289.1 hypothetical protein SAMN05443244_1215 [Terriglobus roseus]